MFFQVIMPFSGTPFQIVFANTDALLAGAALTAGAVEAAPRSERLTRPASTPPTEAEVEARRLWSN